MKSVRIPPPFTIPKVIDDSGQDKKFTFLDFVRNVVQTYAAYGKWPEARKGIKILDLVESLEKQITATTLDLEDTIHESLREAMKAYSAGPGYVMAAVRAGFFDAIDGASNLDMSK